MTVHTKDPDMQPYTTRSDSGILLIEDEGFLRPITEPERLLLDRMVALETENKGRMRDFLAASERVEIVERENTRLIEAIQNAIDHWPGSAPYGAVYYSFVDLLHPEHAESVERGRGIDEANARQRGEALSQDGER